MGNNQKQAKAVFFDRDGTLNVDIHYLHRPQDFIWTEDAKEAIRYCNDKGYLVIVVTNQSGVARGYYSEADVQCLHAWMNAELKKFGAHIDAFYYCPHHLAGTVPAYVIDCDCRKPKTGMLDAACRTFVIDRSRSFFIGDMPSDMVCAQNAKIQGCQFVGGSLLTFVRKVLCGD